jgi:hypothetical protein
MAKFTQTYPTDMKYTEWLLILKYGLNNIVKGIAPIVNPTRP